MTNQETIIALKQSIYENLAPLIGKKTILTDLPYHGNIGDILIWEGELKFLKELGTFPISQTSCTTFTFPKLENDVTICLNGGGNFGDLYRIAQDFRINVIKSYPNNRIIIFPQSIWYDNPSLIESDVKDFSLHNDLYICARDISTYEFLIKYFTRNKILLIPDMAFYIGDLSSKYDKSEKKDKALFIRRNDKEALKSNYQIMESHDTRDWPMFENGEQALDFFLGKTYRILSINNKLLQNLTKKCIDIIMYRFFKNRLIKQGINILSPYNKIYTTRLHAMILGILLDKEIIAFDNTTKKVSDFLKSWLTDDDSVKIIV